MEFSPENWAIVAHNDDSGFGRQAEDLKAVLGVGWHFVIPSERLVDKPLRNERERMLRPDAPRESVKELFRNVAGIIFFERPNWHPDMLSVARELDLRSVCCPNWEWFRGQDPLWKLCDLFVCTSRFSRRIVESYGFRNIADIGPWPLNLNAFPKRAISGPARTFIHNAGIVDPQDRKGTAETIQAFHRTRNQNIRLIVRMQKPAELPYVHDPRIELRVGNLAEPGELYWEGDVAIQPSKMEGNGFMVLESIISGLPTITLDYPPMSEYVLQPEMRVRKRLFKRRAFPTAWVKHAHLRLPSIRDLTGRIEWCAENDMEWISLENRKWGEQVLSKASIRRSWSQALEPIIA